MLTVSTAGADTPAPTRAFVVNGQDSWVTDIDLATMSEVRRPHVGSRPYSPCVSGDGSVLAVTVEGEGKVRFFDVATLKLRGELNVGRMEAEELALLPGGRVAVLANRVRNALLLIDLFEGMEIASIPVNGPHAIRVGSSGRYVYVQSRIDPSISVVDLAGREVVRRHKIKMVPRGLAVSPDEQVVWMGGIWLNVVFGMDTASGKFLHSIAISPPDSAPIVQESTYQALEFIDDHLLLAANEGSSTLDVIDTRIGIWTGRSTEVNHPAGLARIPRSANEFVVSNAGDSSIVRAKLDEMAGIIMLRHGTAGPANSRLSGRLAFHD